MANVVTKVPLNPVTGEESQVKAFINPVYGVDMNQNPISAGVNEFIHNGTDDAYWTASALSGTWDFASTDYAHAGTKSIDGTDTLNGDQVQFEAASAITTDDYGNLCGWVYITKWSDSTKNIQFQNRLAGVNVGDAVEIDTYINTGLFNVWQRYRIPIATFNMGSTTIDQLVITTINLGAGKTPDYYLDDMKWCQTTPFTYTLEADQNSKYTVTNISITVVGSGDTATKVAWDKFFGLSKLEVGLGSQTKVDGVITFSGIFQQIVDFHLITDTTFTTYDDGTDTTYIFDTNFDRPITLNSQTGDYLTFTVNDDLSSLLYFRIATNGVKSF